MSVYRYACLYISSHELELKSLAEGEQAGIHYLESFSGHII